MTPERSSTEALIARVGRRAVAFAGVASVGAWMLPWGDRWTAAAVAGGAALSLVSFWAIRRGVTELADAVIARPDGRPGKAGGPRFLALFVLRHALLAGMAYVMIARLRLSPLGLLCGASVTMLAAAAELTRRFRPS